MTPSPQWVKPGDMLHVINYDRRGRPCTSGFEVATLDLEMYRSIVIDELFVVLAVEEWLQPMVKYDLYKINEKRDVQVGYRLKLMDEKSTLLTMSIEFVDFKRAFEVMSP